MHCLIITRCRKTFTDLVEDDCDFLDDDDDGQEDQSGPTLQQIVALANQYTHWIMLQPSRMDEVIFEKYAKMIGLDDKARDELGEELMKLSTGGLERRLNG